jgi:hypothetical protein
MLAIMSNVVVILGDVYVEVCEEALASEKLLDIVQRY